MMARKTIRAGKTLAGVADGSIMAIDPRAEPAFLDALRAGVTSAEGDDTSWYYSTFGSVAMIQMLGPLWVWGYVALGRAIGEALEDPAVTHILLDIDSPGGRAHNAGDAAAMVRKAHAIKPVTAFVSGQGCSAAYLVAAGAGEIALSKSSEVGCIGTMVSWIDDRGWQKENGLQFRSLVSTQTPNKNLDPNTPEGVAALQARLDEHTRIYVEQLATLRGVSSAVILRDYGAGSTFIGQQAVDAGLADRVSTLDDTIAELQRGLDTQVKLQTGLIYRATSETDVTPLAMTEAALREIPEAAEALAAVASKAAADAVAAAGSHDDEIKAAAVTDAIKAERARLSGVLALQVPGAEKIVSDAIASGASPEAVALEILKDQKDKGVTLGAMRADGTQAPHAGPGAAPVGHGWDASVGRVGGARK